MVRYLSESVIYYIYFNGFFLMLACGLQLIQLKIFTSQNKQIISGGGEGESKYVSLSVNRAPC